MLYKSMVVAGASGRLSSTCAHVGKLGFLGVPFGKGQKKGGFMRQGLEDAPDAVRATTLIQDLRTGGIDVKDYGNIIASQVDSPSYPNMINYSDVMSNNQRVSKGVYDIIKDGRTCLTVGGDHSIFAGTIHGHLGAVDSEDVAVVYVDAHADINLSSTSASGNIHGMPVAMSVTELQNAWKDCPGWLQPKRCISLNNVGYIGLRSVDPPEKEIMLKYGVAAYTINDVVELGVAEVLRRIMQRVDPDNRKSIHLSVDTDSLDPSVAPSTTVPVPGGLLLRELVYITTMLGKTGRVRAMDWVELNVLRGSEIARKQTLSSAITAILAMFGCESSWST